MAANPVTMIKDMIKSLEENPDYNPHYIAHAMMYTKTADSILEGLDIYDLASHKKTEYLKALLIAILPKYEAIEKFLNYPKTIEDWIYAIHYNNGGLKTRAKGMYNKLYRANYGSMRDYMKSEDWQDWHTIHSDDLFK